MENKFPKGVEVVGSGIVEDSQGRILLTRSPKWHNKWTLPGGHVDPGETISEAEVREIQEEVGLNVEFVDIIAWGELINSKDFVRPAHFIYFGVYCKVINSRVELDKKELNDYKWMIPEEALKLNLAETFADTIQKFIAYKSSH